MVLHDIVDLQNTVATVVTERVVQRNTTTAGAAVCLEFFQKPRRGLGADDLAGPFGENAEMSVTVHVFARASGADVWCGTGIGDDPIQDFSAETQYTSAAVDPMTSGEEAVCRIGGERHRLGRQGDEEGDDGCWCCETHCVFVVASYLDCQCF